LASWLIEAGAKAIPGIQFPYTPNGFRHGGAHVYQDMPVPTLTFTQNWETDLNPHFHTPNDFAEGLNFQTLTKSCKFILAGAMAWAYDIVR